MKKWFRRLAWLIVILVTAIFLCYNLDIPFRILVFFVLLAAAAYFYGIYVGSYGRRSDYNPVMYRGYAREDLVRMLEGRDAVVETYEKEKAEYQDANDKLYHVLYYAEEAAYYKNNGTLKYDCDTDGFDDAFDAHYKFRSDCIEAIKKMTCAEYIAALKEKYPNGIHR